MANPRGPQQARLRREQPTWFVEHERRIKGHALRIRRELRRLERGQLIRDSVGKAAK